MKIEINLSLLQDIGLSPDDYTYLYIIYRKAFSYKMPLRVSPRLETDGWIVYKNDISEHVIQQQFRDLFVSNFDSMFAQLCNAYPFKVESPTRGVRVLHAKDPKSASNKKARNKYKKIVSNKPHLHKYIMKCLQLQLEHEKENLGYLQNFETWINNHTWEKYEDMNINDIKDDRRNTRKL
mgnify:CR=1 FL=1|tara:strand:+ start:1944 stop:2483 length:540 start_codon:yes stop_codon:yes gene_type:complete